MRTTIQIEVDCSTATRRNSIRDQIAAQAGTPIEQLVQDTLESARPGITARFAYLSEADALALYAKIQNLLAGQTQTKARLTRHKCTHDQANPTPCIIEAEYMK